MSMRNRWSIVSFFALVIWAAGSGQGNTQTTDLTDSLQQTVDQAAPADASTVRAAAPATTADG